MQDIPEIRLDKTKLEIRSDFDNSDEKEYWLSRTPQERLAYMEMLRRINYGARAGERLQRVIEVVKCEWR
ncbi:MAG: hypothetical protein ACR2MG_14050 [Pyrinomonadaceae bacterium]